jgi:energy-coupling factor transporter transmembrane protein EcfT
MVIGEPAYEIMLDVTNYELLVLNDLMRMFVIQVVVQALFVIRNDNLIFLSQIFVENTLFILLGILVYWLLFNHIIKFKTKDTDSTNLNNHFQYIYNI